MAFSSTAIDISTVAATIISSATTWANTKGASVQCPVVLKVANLSATRVYLGGSNSTGAVGFPLTTAGTIHSVTEIVLTRKSETLFGLSSAGTTGQVHVLAGS